jgi:hypothetical protein
MILIFNDSFIHLFISSFSSILPFIHFFNHPVISSLFQVFSYLFIFQKGASYAQFMSVFLETGKDYFIASDAYASRLFIFDESGTGKKDYL